MFAEGKFRGIVISSETGELDLVRAWLRDAPAGVEIVRVEHYLYEGLDRFSMRCHARGIPTGRNSTGALVQYVQDWLVHLAFLQVPDRICIGHREIKLLWWPTVLARGEVVDDEVQNPADCEFGQEANDALLIWNLLVRPNPLEYQKKLGYADANGCFEAVCTNSQPDQPSSVGPLNHDRLTNSILDTAADWVFLLTFAVQRKLDHPVVQLFRKARRRLLESGAIPDLAYLNPQWERAVSRAGRVKTSTQDRLIIGAMMGQVHRELEAMLLPRLESANGFLTCVLFEIIRLDMRKPPPPKDLADDWSAESGPGFR